MLGQEPKKKIEIEKSGIVNTRTNVKFVSKRGRLIGRNVGGELCNRTLAAFGFFIFEAVVIGGS